MSHTNTIFSNYLIKAVKHFRIGSKSSIIPFFEKFENVKACQRTTFNFNYNDTDYFHPWCNTPSVISKVFTNKFKSPSSSSTKPSKKTKKTISTKIYPTKSNKLVKNTKKPFKKTKNKKKFKKSSDKQPKDKMDIIKLLLQLLC
ncbi:hypothetical protein RclHR1_03770001 [Rhizophagus clarus]|nr:hypothetical protein RclHR1_03770001 [Rhizophagus clarus]